MDSIDVIYVRVQLAKGNRRRFCGTRWIDSRIRLDVEATFNDAALTARLAAAIGRELGKGNVVEIEPAMVSEDIGRSGDGGKMPTAMLVLGAGEAGALAAGTQPGLHSSKFAPASPELVLRTGVRAAVSAVLDLLKR